MTQLFLALVKDIQFCFDAKNINANIRNAAARRFNNNRNSRKAITYSIRVTHHDVTAPIECAGNLITQATEEIKNA